MAAHSNNLGESLKNKVLGLDSSHGNSDLFDLVEEGCIVFMLFRTIPDEPTV